MLPGLHRITAALSALLLGCAGAHAAEDAVLLASTAPGYGPGMVVAAADRLLLPDGASVTLLLRSGQMLRLRGPLETSLDRVAVAPRNEGSAVALAEALRLGGVDASVIGGTRELKAFAKVFTAIVVLGFIIVPIAVLAGLRPGQDIV